MTNTYLVRDMYCLPRYAWLPFSKTKRETKTSSHSLRSFLISNCLRNINLHSCVTYHHVIIDTLAVMWVLRFATSKQCFDFLTIERSERVRL